MVSICCVLEKNGGKKKRLILDLKQSGMSAKARKKTHRVVHPRISDVIQDGLSLASGSTTRDDYDFFVLDFTDAFWHVPLHPSERQYFIGFDGVRYWMYLRAAQGSRNGPLAWAGPSALLARCTQGLLSGSGESTNPRGRLQLYVDDPCISIRGTTAERDDLVAAVVLSWLLCGFQLAFSKAQRGKEVTWIGAGLRHDGGSVTVTIPAAKLDEFRELVDTDAVKNIMSNKNLRKLAGKANHVASILYVWMPFLSELWGAIRDFDAESAS